MIAVFVEARRGHRRKRALDPFKPRVGGFEPPGMVAGSQTHMLLSAGPSLQLPYTFSVFFLFTEPGSHNLVQVGFKLVVVPQLSRS